MEPPISLYRTLQAKSRVIIRLKHPLSLKYRQIQKYFIKSRVDIEKKI